MAEKERWNRNSDTTFGTISTVQTECDGTGPSNILKLFLFSKSKPTNLNTIGNISKVLTYFQRPSTKRILTHDIVPLGRNLAPGERDSNNASSRIAAFITRKQRREVLFNIENGLE
jgi:hypothetical protein